jgi:pimeloyl-ACP methyl ester carboxylesterase
MTQSVVLIHSAWGGGWCWERTAPRLAAGDRTVLTPTLTGLGDAAGEATPETGLSDHVAQITKLAASLDGEVVLVGHSYGGMVAAGVAAQMPEQISKVVYLDSFVPTAGESAFDILPWLGEACEAARLPDRPWLIAPFDVAGLGVDDPQDQATIQPRMTPMLYKAFTDKSSIDARSIPVPVSYIRCARQEFFAETANELQKLHWQVVDIDAAHMAPLTAPEALASTLNGLLG